MSHLAGMLTPAEGVAFQPSGSDNFTLTERAAPMVATAEMASFLGCPG